MAVSTNSTFTRVYSIFYPEPNKSMRHGEKMGWGGDAGMGQVLNAATIPLCQGNLIFLAFNGRGELFNRAIKMATWQRSYKDKIV